MTVPYNLVFLFKVGPGIFLCIVGKIWAILVRHLQQPVIIKKLTGSKWKSPKSDVIQTTLGFFLCNVVWSLLGNIAQSFCLCNVVLRVFWHYWTGFFHVKCFLEALGQHCTRFLPVQCCPKSIKTTLNRIFSCAMLCAGFFPVQCRLQPIGQYCTKLLPVQCCPKSIKATLSRFFSCAMFSGVSWSNYQDFVFSWNLSFGKKFGRNS